jgi:hypothetical protein
LRIVREAQLSVAEDVLEESEEDLDRPAILIQHRDRLRRHIQQVRGHFTMPLPVLRLRSDAAIDFREAAREEAVG